MIKKVYFIVGVVVLLCLLGVAGCGTDKNTIEGKYICTDYMSELYKGHEVYYYIFSKDGTYTTNYYEINGYGKELDDMGITWYDYGTYRIDENKLTLFNGEEESDDIELGSVFGYIYKDTICSKWEGKLPLERQEEEIFSNSLEVLFFEVHFTEDGNYKYIVTGENGEIFETTTGTYEVNKNKVECKNEEGLITTFYDTDDGVYGVDYIKE